MNPLKSNEVLISGVQTTFNFVSFRQTMMILDCSKFYLNKLVNNGTIKAYYLEVKEGKPTGKPYFSKREIEEAFIPKEIITE